MRVYGEEEKWKSFPGLRKILMGKQLPDRYPYFGPTSTHDSIFDQIYKRVEIARITCEFGSEINNTGDSSNLNEIMSDLEQIAGGLEWARSFIDDTARRLKDIRSETAKRLYSIRREAESKSS